MTRIDPGPKSSVRPRPSSEPRTNHQSHTIFVFLFLHPCTKTRAPQRAGPAPGWRARCQRPGRSTSVPCDNTKAWFPDVCVLALTLCKVEQEKDVEGGQFSLVKGGRLILGLARDVFLFHGSHLNFRLALRQQAGTKDFWLIGMSCPWDATVTLAPPLVLPVLPAVLLVTAPVNLASSSSCLRGSRLCSSSMGTGIRGIDRGNISNVHTNNADESVCVLNIFWMVGGREIWTRIRDNNRDHRLKIEKKMDMIELGSKTLFFFPFKKCTVTPRGKNALD